MIDKHPEQTVATDMTNATILPVVEEKLVVGREKITTDVVRVRKIVREHEEQVHLMLERESVEVRRVPMERFVDSVPLVRHEGDVMIVPVVEEVLVVEKRLMLREEVHVRKTRTTEPHDQTVTLRSEEAVIERHGDKVVERHGEMAREKN